MKVSSLAWPRSLAGLFIFRLFECFHAIVGCEITPFDYELWLLSPSSAYSYLARERSPQARNDCFDRRYLVQGRLQRWQGLAGPSARF